MKKKLFLPNLFSVVGACCICVSCSTVTGKSDVIFNDDENHLEFIAIDGPTSLTVGEKATFTATIIDADPLIEYDVRWAIEDTRIGVINEKSGEFEALRDGSTVIYAYFADNPRVISPWNITVNLGAPTKLTIYGPDVVYLEDETTARYEVEYFPSPCLEGVKWVVSRGSDFATISEDGVLYPTHDGNITVKATSTQDKTIKAEKNIVIEKKRATEITIVGESRIKLSHGAVSYSINYLPEKTLEGVTWSVDDTSVATVDENTGLLTPLKVGKVTLTAKYKYNEKVTNSLTIEVLDDSYYAVSILQNAGHSYDLIGTPIVDKHQSICTCKLQSTTYKLNGSLPIPIHKPLQKEEVEVLCGDKKIDFQIKNNILTFLTRDVDNDVSINVLGSEISDYITWEELVNISNNDFQTRDEKEVEKMFQVGDYKKYYDEEGHFRTNCIIIDMHHDVCADGDPPVETKIPFTFEMEFPVLDLNENGEIQWTSPNQRCKAFKKYYGDCHWTQDDCGIRVKTEEYNSKLFGLERYARACNKYYGWDSSSLMVHKFFPFSIKELNYTPFDSDGNRYDPPIMSLPDEEFTPQLYGATPYAYFCPDIYKRSDWDIKQRRISHHLPEPDTVWLLDCTKSGPPCWSYINMSTGILKNTPPTPQPSQIYTLGMWVGFAL